MSIATKRAYLKVLAGGGGTFMRHIKMFRAALAALVTVVLTSQLQAADIFVSPTGNGEKTGANWSNALNGSNDGWHIDVKNAITAAIDGGAEDVNVYLAAGDYTVTNQLALSSITIPVKFCGGYVGETDGSMEKSEELKTTLKRNTSYKTRFFEITSLSNLAIDSMSFTGGYLNESAPVGGAIKLTSTTVLIHECVFENNGIKNSKANHATGGAIAALSSGNLEVINCLFANNYIGQGALSSVSHGGAIYTYKVNTKIKNTTFKGNYAKDISGKATYWGGGIESIYKDIEITDCVFDGNYVHNQSGSGGHAIAGAISVRNANKFYMSNTRISGCYSRNSKASYRNYAGIIYLDDCNAKDGSMVSVIERCVFDSYNCPSSGSPASKSDILLNSGFLYMTNCLISAERGNHTHGNYSIRIEKCAAAQTLRCTSNDGYTPISACYAELVNVTIADGQGAGVAALSDDADLILKNCIISGNATAGVINATSIEHSYIQTNVDDGTWNYEGEGNLNPNQVGDINWTGAPYYHLLTKNANGAITNGWFSGTFESPKTAADSPCIDAGAPGSLGLDLEPYYSGRRVNIGAYGGTPWASKTSPLPGFKLIIR